MSHLNAASAGLMKIYDDVLTLIPGSRLLYHESIKTDKIQLDEIQLNNKFVFANEELTDPIITPSKREKSAQTMPVRTPSGKEVIR